MRCTGIDLRGRKLKTDGAKLLARFLAVPKVWERITRIDLRSVSDLKLNRFLATQQLHVQASSKHNDKYGIRTEAAYTYAAFTDLLHQS